MRASRTFEILSIIHEGIHYFPDTFSYNENNVNAEIMHKRNRWVKDSLLITVALADEIKDYAKKQRRA